jgi:hypothetical protein
MTRKEIHAHFFNRFCAKEPFRPAAPVEINRAEAQLGIEFPESYRHFMLNFGKVTSSELLDLIVATKSKLLEVNSILAAEECVLETEAFRGDCLSNRMVIFAADSFDCFFCFKFARAPRSRADDASIWYFQPWGPKAREIAPSFDAWLESYVIL